MRRFPYVIYNKIENSDIIIFGLFHGARDPHLIRKEMKSRT